MYADATFYKETFLGSAVPEADLPAALTRGSELIDSLTYCRINRFGFANLSGFRQNCIKLACCVLAEDVYSGGYLQPGPFLAAGFSLGDLSVPANASQTLIDGIAVSGRAIVLLRQTGLMYPGVIA